MIEVISAKRKNDAVMTVSQDNAKKQVVIEGMNRAAEKLTGYKEEELRGQSIQKVLTDTVQELISSYLEFDREGSDLADVFRKLRDFHIVTRNTKEAPVSLKVFYVISSHPERPQFELLMRDVTLLSRLEELKAQMVVESKESQGSVPGNEVIERSLHLVCDAVGSLGLEASFALIRCDQLSSLRSRFGDEAEIDVVHYMHKLARQNLRSGDLFGHIEGGVCALILLDCNHDDATLVLNRLRSSIEATPFDADHLPDMKAEKVTVAVGFKQIAAPDAVQELVTRCEHALGRAEANSVVAV